jgi:hypothetical protein
MLPVGNVLKPQEAHLCRFPSRFWLQFWGRLRIFPDRERVFFYDCPWGVLLLPNSFTRIRDKKIVRELRSQIHSMAQLRNTVDAHALDLHYQVVVLDLHARTEKEVVLLGVHLDFFLNCQFLGRKQPHSKGLLPLHHVLVSHEVLVVLLLALVGTGLRRRRRFLVLHDLQSLFL